MTFRIVKIYCVSIALILFINLSYCGRKSDSQNSRAQKEMTTGKITIKSSAFNDGETIPVKYTCEGEDISVPLEWSNIPEGVKSLALVCDDPDAPMGTWVHWVVINIPPEISELSEGIVFDKDSLLAGTIECHNSFDRVQYGGPCPPKGPVHRYFFKLYALDRMLELDTKADKADAEKAMEGHILAQAALMGRFGR